MISLKKHGKNAFEVVVAENDIKRLNKNDVKEGLDHSPLTNITRKYPPEHKEIRYELVDNLEKPPTRIFLHE